MIMSFQELIAAVFWDNMTPVTGFGMVVAVVSSFCVGLFISFVYNKVYQGAMNSKSFAISLVILPMITAALISTITSNVTLTLGMVGALSIVRFRAAIKDPMEIVFLFWAIETGILFAARLAILSFGVNLVIGIVLLALFTAKGKEPYLLIVQCDKSKLKTAQDIFKQHLNFKLKSQTNSNEKWEYVYEVTLAHDDGDTSFMDDLNKNGVSASLISYNGAYSE